MTRPDQNQTHDDYDPRRGVPRERLDPADRFTPPDHWVPAGHPSDHPRELNTDPTEVSIHDPFNGDSVAFRLNAEVNINQLLHELREAAGNDELQLLIYGPAAPEQPVAADNPQTLVVSPKDTGERLVSRVVKQHTKNDEWGLSDEQKARRAVHQKLTQGEKLDEDELHLALRTLFSIQEQTSGIGGPADHAQTV